MPRSKNQKLKLLYLCKILLERTDEAHPMTVAQMGEELEKLGIHAQRKSLYSDLCSLREFGLDLVCCRSRTTSYFVANRGFELPELKILADAVACSRFITEKKSAQLVGKISRLASGPEASLLERQVFVRGRAKTQNEQIYYNVDTVHRAIALGRAVAFRYFGYRVDWASPHHWTKQYRRGGEKHVAFPYALVWNDENYYMTACYEQYGGITNFRVDKMEQIEILPPDAFRKPEGSSFSPAEYSKKVFGMFSGNGQRVTLRFDNSLIGVVLDRFGKDVVIRKADGAGFAVTFEAIAGPTMLGWIFEFGSKVRILEPESLARELCRMSEEELSIYPALEAPQIHKEEPCKNENRKHRPDACRKISRG